MANATTPVITLESAEAQEKHHLEQAAYHQGKANSWALIKQAILDVSSPEPGYGHQSLASVIPSMAIPVPHGTKKLNCLDILNSLGPMTTQEIVVQLNKRGFADSNQPNTSPQLSLYRGIGLIKLEGSVWHLTPKGRDLVAAEKN